MTTKPNFGQTYFNSTVRPDPPWTIWTISATRSSEVSEVSEVTPDRDPGNYGRQKRSWTGIRDNGAMVGCRPAASRGKDERQLPEIQTVVFTLLAASMLASVVLQYYSLHEPRKRGLKIRSFAPIAVPVTFYNFFVVTKGYF